MPCGNMGMPAAKVLEKKSANLPPVPLEERGGGSPESLLRLTIREIWELETEARDRRWDADHIVVVVWRNIITVVVGSAVVAVGLTEPRVVGLDVVGVESAVAR